LRALLGHLLSIKADEIDRIDIERREAAIAYGGRDDFAREWKQQTRALDHHDRLDVFLRHVLQPEDAGKGEVECGRTF